MYLKYFIVLSSVVTFATSSIISIQVSEAKKEKKAKSGSAEERGRFARGLSPLPTSNLSLASREQILDAYNTARSSTIPKSSNMQIVIWNDELASLAESHVRKCSNVVNERLPDDSKFSLAWGYGLLVSKGATESVTIQAIFESIIDVDSNYQYGVDDCIGDAFCSISALTIRADTHEIGCAYNICEDDDMADPGQAAANSFACFQDLKLSLIDENGTLILPYEAGEPCSNCPTELPYCDINYSLCSPNASVLPKGLEIEADPGPQNTPAKERFENPAVITLLGEDGLFLDFAYPSCAWYVGVLISYGSNPHAELIGETEVQIVDGYANFTNLAISKQGEYTLTFYISSPDDISDEKFFVSTGDITISPPLDTWESCEVQEGENRFERLYTWGSGCSEVCIADCEGSDAECVDLDECGPHAMCIDDECVCKDRQLFDYNVFDQDRIEETINPIVHCMPNHMEIKLDKCGLNAMGYNLGNMYMFGPGSEDADINAEKNLDDQIFPFIESCEYNDCRGHVTADENGLVYSFMIQNSFHDCNGHVEVNDTHIQYSHKVRGYGGLSNSVISRKRHLHVSFTCSYLRSLWSTAELFVNPFIKTVKLNLQSVGNFDIGFGIWEDSTYLRPITEPPMIQIPDPIYVGIYAKNVDVVLYAEYCFVTLTEDLNDTVYHDLIVDGCRADDRTAIIPQSGEGDQVLFSFDSFAFDGHRNTTTMFLHCQIKVCVTDMAPCTTSCSGRKRRAATPASPIDVATSATISLGPITLVNSERKRRALDDKYASSFSSDYATQELANPPFARTTGLGSSFTLLSK